MASFGALSSLGLGSSGVLSYDVIDKLRKADESIILKPIDKNLSTLQEKEKNLSTITTLTAGLKSSIIDLASGTFYAKRTSSVSGDNVSVEVSDGVAEQDVSITVNQLATKDIWESQGFATESSTVTTKDTTMSITLDGSTYDIAVTAGTTLEGLRDAINDQTDGTVTASILNTGGTNPYELILKSTQTGVDQAISVTYDDGDPNTTNDDFLNLNNVQVAQDAEFVYNGITVTRSNNDISDLISGVTFHLLSADSTATNNITISQDKNGIADTVSAFVDAYNSWYSAMHDATKYDPDKKTAGIFQDENSIKRLFSDVTRTLFATTAEGQGVATYGLSVNKDGLLSFDKKTFLDALANHGDEVEKVFSSSTDGIFNRLNTLLADVIDPTNGTLTLLDKEYQSEQKSLQTERERNVASLDARYNIMAQRFSLYDSMINSMNASFQALSSMIESQNKSKS